MQIINVITIVDIFLLKYSSTLGYEVKMECYNERSVFYPLSHIQPVKICKGKGHVHVR
jgi:hypothetical protein